MTSRQGQEQQPSYMDGVKVKISERYKRPPKISLPTSYSQRLSLNDHIRNNIAKYDFTFERNAKECMRALREAKLATANERKDQLDKIKEARRKEEDDRLKQEQERESNDELNEKVNMNNGVLIPTQVPSSYSNVLTPTSFPNCANTYSYQSIDKSPFNISDFESDTSSPFDNMALKTINDMAELAIVLQNDDQSNKQKYSSYTPVKTDFTQTYTSYTGGNQQYTYPDLPSTSTPAYIQPSNSVYSARNGYYYNNPVPVYDSSYLYNNNMQRYNNSYEVVSPEKSSDEDALTARTKTVPDIMKALETELNNTHLNKANPVPVQVKTREGSKSESKDDEIFRSLPKNLQILSKNISGMGFPVDRVCKVCKLFGDDQKKVVEHLLAMSDLLDLGFPETQVSNALMECDNDRDKALDKLIL